MLPMGQIRAQAPQREHLLQSVRGLAFRNLAGAPSSFSGVIRQLFFHFEANRRFYSLIYERGLIDLVKDLFLETFGFNPAQDLVPAYSSAYVAFLLYGWVEVWFRRGMKETVAELADCLGKSVDSAMKAQSKRQEQV